MHAAEAPPGLFSEQRILAASATSGQGGDFSVSSSVRTDIRRNHEGPGIVFTCKHKDLNSNFRAHHKQSQIKWLILVIPVKRKILGGYWSVRLA